MEKGCLSISSNNVVVVVDGQQEQQQQLSGNNRAIIELKSEIQSSSTSQATGSSMSTLRKDLEDCVSSNSQHGFAVVLDDESSTSGVLETFEISSSNSLPTSTGVASNVDCVVVAVDDSSSTDTLTEQTGSTTSQRSVGSLNNVFYNDAPVVCLINDDDDDEDVDDDDVVEDDDDEEDIGVDDEEDVDGDGDGEIDGDGDDQDDPILLDSDQLSANTSQMVLADGTVDGMILAADGSKIFLETPVVEEALAHPSGVIASAQCEYSEKNGKPKRLSDEFMYGEEQADEPAESIGIQNEYCELGSCSTSTGTGSSQIASIRRVKSELVSTEETDSAVQSETTSLHDRLMSVRLKQMSLTAPASVQGIAATVAGSGTSANTVSSEASSSRAPLMSQADIESMDLIERRDFETEQRLTGGILLRTSSVIGKNKLNVSLIKSCKATNTCGGGSVSSSSDDWPSSSSSNSNGRVVSSDSKCTYKDLSTTPTSSRKYTNSRLSKSTAKLNLGSTLNHNAGTCAQHSSRVLSAAFLKSNVIVDPIAVSSGVSGVGKAGAARADVYTSTTTTTSINSSNNNDRATEYNDSSTSTTTSFNSVASQTCKEGAGCSRTTALHTGSSSSNNNNNNNSSNGGNSISINGSESASCSAAAALDDAQPSTSSARCQYAGTSKSSTSSSSTRQVNASAQTSERFLSRISGGSGGGNCTSVGVNVGVVGNASSNATIARQRRQSQRSSGNSNNNNGANDVIVLEVVVEENNGNGEALLEHGSFNADEPWANCDEENNCSDLEEICTCQNSTIGGNSSSFSGSNASLTEALDIDAIDGSYYGDDIVSGEGGIVASSNATSTVLGCSANSSAQQQRKRKYNDGRLLDSDYSMSLTSSNNNATTGENINCRKRIAYDFTASPRSTLGSAPIAVTPTAMFGGCSSSASATLANSPMGRRTPRSLVPTRDNPPPELQHWLTQFLRWSDAERLVAVDRLIEHCDASQVRHMMKVIEPQFQRDFISLLPRELALFVLSYLEPKDLLRAAQTCRSWRFLCDDNLLWKEKCRKSQILSETRSDRPKRGRDGNMPPISSPWKAAYMRQHIIEMNWRSRPVRKPKVLKGHDDHVITCLQFSGNRIVSGSDDNTLKVWSAVNGKCLRTLVGHTGGVWSSQMSGNIIISGSTDRTLKVWDMDSGACVHTLQGHTSTVRCMHLHGSKVVSGSRDATLRVWDIEQGSCLHVLVGHLAAVRCVQYDGKLIVSGAYDYMVKIWHPERQECLHTLQGHTNRVYSLQFDGIHVVSGSLDTSIRVWDVETGNCKHTLMGHQSLTSGMELRQNILVSGNADSTVKVWDITTGQCLQTLSGPNKHQSAVTCLQFNSRFVVTSSDDGTVKLWDVKTGEFIRNLVALDSGGSGGVVWRIRANDTKLICAVGSRNGTEETKLMVLDFDVEGACVKCS